MGPSARPVECYSVERMHILALSLNVSHLVEVAGYRCCSYS